MDPLIPVPREALTQLLLAAGSTQTPEEYVASLQQADLFRKYPSRVTASAWSKYILLGATVLSVLLLPFLFSIEALVITVLLVWITVEEFRINSFFRNHDLRAPGLGFRNQSIFAAMILVYGLYHGFTMTMDDPALREYNNLVDADAMKLIQDTTRTGYYLIGVLGGLSQFWLAWYYRSARVGAYQ